MDKPNDEASQATKVKLLEEELARARQRAALLEPGRLDKCPTLKKLATAIRHRMPEDDADPLVDAMDVLMESAEELPEGQSSIFNMMFAVGEYQQLRKLEDRRASLARSLGIDIKTLRSHEAKVLTTVAYTIVRREQETRLGQAENQIESSKSDDSTRGKPEPSLSIDRIEVTLVLDDEARPARRESVFTATASQDLGTLYFYEFSEAPFTILGTVNCDIVLDFSTLPDIRQLKELERLKEQPELKERPELQSIAQELGNILDTLRTITAPIQEAAALADELGAFPNSLKLPSLRSGQSHTFSYTISYSSNKDAQASSLIRLEDQWCGFVHGANSSTGIFVCRPGQALRLLRVQLRTDRPLKVVPFTTETMKLAHTAILPQGVPNYVAPDGDGLYQRVFHGVEPHDVHGFVWFIEH
jgi:hypothetical protein